MITRIDIAIFLIIIPPASSYLMEVLYCIRRVYNIFPRFNRIIFHGQDYLHLFELLYAPITFCYNLHGNVRQKEAYLI